MNKSVFFNSDILDKSLFADIIMLFCFIKPFYLLPHSQTIIKKEIRYLIL